MLDNIGFTDNYIECMIPTVGVYPIATANEKDQISAPLMSRFAVIEIPDYTPEEKKVIFLPIRASEGPEADRHAGKMNAG